MKIYKLSEGFELVGDCKLVKNDSNSFCVYKDKEIIGSLSLKELDGKIEITDISLFKCLEHLKMELVNKLFEELPIKNVGIDLKDNKAEDFFKK